MWFGPATGTSPRSRFDAPGGEFGVCYPALSPEAAFAETFLRNPGRRMLDAALIGSRAVTRLTPARRLNAVRLYGPGLARVGASAEVTHGPAYDLARPDGILYKPRHDGDEPCLALFDRRPDQLVVESTGPIMGTALLTGLLRRYRISLDTSA